MILLLINFQTSHEDNEVTLEVEQNDEIGNICFNSTSVPDGIPGITGMFHYTKLICCEV